MADPGVTAAVRALRSGWGLTAELQPLGEGHINDTLLASAASERYVVQRINRRVFADPALVMGNLVRVLEHLGATGEVRLPALVPTVSGMPAFVDDRDDWWRVWRHVAGGRSLSRTSDPNVCRAAGEAFGRFQRRLSSLPGPRLEPTIPGFLELQGYLDRFDRVLDTSAHGGVRVAAAAYDPGFIGAHRALAARFPRAEDLIHGDCKLNNLLFSMHAPEVLAVLDLDTVMVGHWAWDLGDLARSVLLGADRSRVRSLLPALVDGFTEGSGRGIPSETAKDAAVYVAFLLGIRFLTDHLEGDHYFRVRRRGENLERAKAQFALVRLLT